MEICDRLKLTRKSYGKSQAKFSNRLGVAQSTWGQYEIGKRSVSYDVKQNLASLNIHWAVTGNGPTVLSNITFEQETKKDRIIPDRSESPKDVSESIPEYPFLCSVAS